MDTARKKPVVIQQEYEAWEGVKSVPRVLELRGVGISKNAICLRFQISRPTLNAAIKEFKRIAAKAAGDAA